MDCLVLRIKDNTCLVKKQKDSLCYLNFPSFIKIDIAITVIGVTANRANAISITIIDLDHPKINFQDFIKRIDCH